MVRLCGAEGWGGMSQVGGGVGGCLKWVGGRDRSASASWNHHELLSKPLLRATQQTTSKQCFFTKNTD